MSGPGGHGPRQINEPFVALMRSSDRASRVSRFQHLESSAGELQESFNWRASAVRGS